MSTDSPPPYWHEMTKSPVKQNVRLFIEVFAVVLSIGLTVIGTYNYPRFALIGAGLVASSVFVSWLFDNDT